MRGQRLRASKDGAGLLSSPYVQHGTESKTALVSPRSLDTVHGPGNSISLLAYSDAAVFTLLGCKGECTSDSDIHRIGSGCLKAVNAYQVTYVLSGGEGPLGEIWLFQVAF